MTKAVTPCLRGEPTILECLNCNEAVCIEDMRDTGVLRKTTEKSLKIQARNEQIVAWKGKGKTFREISEISGLSKRQLTRIISDERRKDK